VAALALAATPALAQTTEVFSFSDSADGIFANGRFLVDATPNANGTYDIENIVMADVVNMGIVTPPPAQITDTVMGLVSNPNQPDPTVAYGFQYDNVTPLNTNGVLFEGQSSAIYNLWATGAGVGELYTYGANGVPNFDAHGTLSVTAAPEPATWARMLIGFGGLGVAMRGRKTKAVAA
jgi:hypothetical protein